MQPTKIEFIYEEWKKTIEDIGTHGMSLELYNHLIGHLIAFFKGDHNFFEYGEEVRERSLPLVSDYANRFGLTKDTKESAALKRLCKKISTARSSLFMDVWDGQKPPELKKIRRELRQLKMALERGDGTSADSQVLAVSQMQSVSVQVFVPPAADDKFHKKVDEHLQGIKSSLDMNHNVLKSIHEAAIKDQANRILRTWRQARGRGSKITFSLLSRRSFRRRSPGPGILSRPGNAFASGSRYNTL
jgi:hypothetical protein